MEESETRRGEGHGCNVTLLMSVTRSSTVSSVSLSRAYLRVPADEAGLLADRQEHLAQASQPSGPPRQVLLVSARGMSSASAAANKRLALSREQRSVLEAVYAIEKLPDATLRDRLSKYLNLSARAGTFRLGQSTGSS